YYGSDGLKVAAFIWRPSNIEPGKRLPAVISLRGGNRDFGKFGPDSQRRMAALTTAGFVVIGVQYRGVDGGEGQEEFGGADVHDVLNAIHLARSLPGVDPSNVFMWGRSRGGMMAYLAVRDGADVNAFVAESALADVLSEAERRPELPQRVWSQLMPDWSPSPEAAMRRRSPIEFADKVDMPPVLLLHGTADWRAHPDNSLQMASRLQSKGRPYELHVFENDTHSLDLNWRERDRLVIDWFRRHMR
ncbi:alpha/beta hydrolase family protein, partial [Phenylobacterium sp.]|uniref:alpha/beta hydrolase family protein n=1 Tax=Phenylobacterium sp. TaxID=1871053 RepID=UPI002E376647